MPVQLPTIDDEILYILDKWIQNSSQLITGTIGQNVVWNLAQFIKQNPENYKKASVVTAANINYTTQSSECIIIFTNNSAGSFDFGDNIWNKWYVINQTNNVRTIAGGKFYYNLNGVATTSILPKTAIEIVKGNDDFWYLLGSTTYGISVPKPLFKFVVDSGRANNPVSGTSIWQSDILKNLGADYDNEIEITLDSGTVASYGTNRNMTYDPVTGTIDLDYNGTGNTWQAGSGGSVDLNQ